ncbi:hypothetical protein FNN84_21205 [Salmonella enterica subsp. salamae]|uniref:Lipoprotein n=1 Tax=Salmonella enterica subsp. salamae TaxID=59202 RepID=A0A5Y2S6I3_SALER|nr:hypothetical protein [Salmonella enterica subsp. salamae]ECJ2312404.1 hypothetical protein [Salmonella enterica subsp. salamae]
MNKVTSKFIVLGLISLLTACSGNQSSHKTASATTGYKGATNKPTDNFIAKKTSSLSGITIASTNNICVDHFNFLRETHASEYNKYTHSYGQIGSGYTFLNVNKNIMDDDAKKVYTMMLEMKLDTLCAKVQYTGYGIVKGKIKELSAI